jgi:ribosome biogenesis GTPase A
MKALENIHKRSFDANVLLEIRDVRLPASTHHPSFTRLAKHRLHLICYTHADMIDAITRDRVRKWSQLSWPDSDCFFADTRDSRGSPECFESLYQWILNSLDKRGGARTALTVGVPNTGKSSVLLNLLKHARHAGLIPKQVKARVNLKKKSLRAIGGVGIQDAPGKTRELTDYLLLEKPRTYFLDVPGMTPPHFLFEERPEAWYGFGAANLIMLPKHYSENVECQTLFCEYVLYAMNRDRLFDYVKQLNLTEPTYDVHSALSKLGGKYKDKLEEDTLKLKQCKIFLKLFNTGNFGPLILDDIQRPFRPFRFRNTHFQKNKGGRDYDDDDNDERDYRKQRGEKAGRVYDNQNDDDEWDNKQRGKKGRRDNNDDNDEAFSFKAK